MPLPAGLTPPLVVNPTAAGLFRVEYDDYAPVLEAIRGGRLDPRGTAALIDDAFHLQRSGSSAVNITSALEIVRAALESTGDYTQEQGTCPYEDDGECDPVLWGASRGADSPCPSSSPVSVSR